MAMSQNPSTRMVPQKSWWMFIPSMGTGVTFAPTLTRVTYANPFHRIPHFNLLGLTWGQGAFRGDLGTLIRRGLADIG